MTTEESLEVLRPKLEKFGLVYYTHALKDVMELPTENIFGIDYIRVDDIKGFLNEINSEMEDVIS